MTTRRDFLKQGSALGTAAIVASQISAMSHAQEEKTQGEKPAVVDGRKVSYTVPMAEKLRATPARREITIPNVGEYQVLKGDFHMHTLFSDGIVWPNQRVIEAHGNGLDVISITDHIEYRIYLGGNGRGLKLQERNDDHNISYEFAKSEADKRNVILVRGTEITKSTMPPGHFNALFVQDVNLIAEKVDDHRKMYEETVRQGGFLLWNHPGWQAPKSGGIEPGAPTIFTKDHEEFHKNGWLHGVEALNNKEFYPIVSEWCEEKDLAIFANSDIHITEFEEYGVRNPRRPITLILAKERTHDAIKEAFIAKRTIAYFADMIVGREKFVRPLFNACVEIKTEGDNLLFQNKSSIPVTIKYGTQTVLIAPLGTGQTKRNAEKTLTVENWQIGMDKPLTVELT